MSEPNGKMLLSEISQLRQQLSTSEAEKLDLIQRFDSLKGFVSILETELTRCNNELKDLRLQVADDPDSELRCLRQKVVLLTESLQEKDRQIAELSATISLRRDGLDHGNSLNNVALENKFNVLLPCSTPPDVITECNPCGQSPAATSTPVGGHDDVKVTLSSLATGKVKRHSGSFDETHSLIASFKQQPQHPLFVESNTEDEQKTMLQEKRFVRTHGYGDERRSMRNGFKQFFGRLRRTNSQSMADKEDLDFQRSNGLRATAGPRLQLPAQSCHNINLPFNQWDAERLALWLHSIGLGGYVGNCKRNVRSGQQLLNLSASELEKELGMRNYFHLKKLVLALDEIKSNSNTEASRLDFKSVLRWLDDIGLPQYKDVFQEARLDGRMLNLLTVDDLLRLGINNQLHHSSIKCGIQVLRANRFDLSCLQRRPAQDEGLPVEDSVILWTCHRVMDWLKTIDFSEYAANLRGSGVHGGLLVFESRFTAELLSSLLYISSTKTLLRRHLTTHFVSLIGVSVQQQKRLAEAIGSPLTACQKVKARRGGFFSRPNATLNDNLLCPVELTSSNSTTNDASIGAIIGTMGDSNLTTSGKALSTPSNMISAQLAYNTYDSEVSVNVAAHATKSAPRNQAELPSITQQEASIEQPDVGMIRTNNLDYMQATNV